MVETKNNYKKRYNRGTNHRRYNNGGNGKRHGLLNFLFSLEGKISKNLFIGFGLFLTLISFAFDMISVAIPAENQIIDNAFNLVNLILLWILIALGYKRAHSLGISGFYSIIGTVIFKPFFCFLRTDRDFPNDSAYKNHFDRFKKIGYFFDKNIYTRILYILIIGTLTVVPYAFIKKNALPSKDFVEILKFILGIVVFNILQLFVINKKWFRRYYSNTVKTLSFIGYNIVIVALSVFFYSAYILMLMMQSVQNTPK